MSTDNWIELNVALPLPLDVAGVLMRLVGTAYPSAVVDMSGKSGKYGLAMRIDPRERVRDVTAEEADAIVRSSQPELTSFGGDADFSTSTPEELTLWLGEMAHAIFTGTEGAINYLEWQVHTAGDEQYVLSIAKSKSQMPSSMLEKANARIAELEAGAA